MRSKEYRLQFITHHNERFTYADSARLALEGGCRWVQLRMKDKKSVVVEATALEVKELCCGYGAKFIIDDDVWLAKRIGADGVHLGKEDMPVAEAREILGEGFIIGATVNSFSDILHHTQGTKPDYFGCGPYRFTTTKERLSPILGIEGYREIIRRMREHDIDIPLVAIGGIKKEDVPQLLASGVDGIALSGSILRADDPIQEMQKIVELIKNIHNN